MTKTAKTDFDGMTEEEALAQMTAKLSHLKGIEVDYEAIAKVAILTDITEENAKKVSSGTELAGLISGIVIGVATDMLAEKLGMSKEEAAKAFEENDIYYLKHLNEVELAALNCIEARLCPTKEDDGELLPKNVIRDNPGVDFEGLAKKAIELCALEIQEYGLVAIFAVNHELTYLVGEALGLTDKEATDAFDDNEPRFTHVKGYAGSIAAGLLREEVKLLETQPEPKD